MSTIHGSRLRQLHDLVAAQDPSSVLDGVSYRWCTSNIIDSSRWWIAMPYGRIPEPGSNPDLPLIAPLQEAIHWSMDDRSHRTCFLDIAHLQTASSSFFDEKTISRLAEFVNGMPVSVTPCIRYLTGAPGAQGPILNDGLLRGLWDAVTHPKAMLFYGNFCPDVDLPAAWARDEQSCIPLLRAFATAMGRSDGFQSALQTWVRTFVEALQESGMPAFSWNHSKIFAVNGSSLVTGGANYWAEYATGQGMIFDLGMRIQGDAAAAAQVYLNHIWNYLAGRPQTDRGSWCVAGPIAAKRLVPTTKVPTFVPHTPATGGVDALAVGRAGMWPTSGQVTSVQLFDAIRDLLLNLAAEMVLANRKQAPGSSSWGDFIQLCTDLGDTGPVWQGLMERVGASSAAWATRSVRNAAMAGATSKIRLAQQKMVMDDLVRGSACFRALVSEVNSTLGISWSGYFWPYDQLIAIGEALCRFYQSTDTSAGVEIIASLLQDEQGYADPIEASDFRSRLGAVMTGMPCAKAIELSAPDLSRLIDQRVGYRRVLPGGFPRQLVTVQHSKFVCIDDVIAYVGSDNAYPSYNLEFGLWIDDLPAMNWLVEKYWDPLWQLASPSENPP